MGSTSIRANSVPAGGVTATVVSSSGVPMVPTTDIARQYSEALANAGERNVTKLSQLTLVPGQTSSLQVRNTGLGQSIDIPVSGSISFVNSAVGAVALDFAPEFPFNLISRIGVQFNGQTNIISMTGYEALTMMAKRNKNVYVRRTGLTGAYAQLASRVTNVQASVTAGANATLTAGDALCGYSSVSIAGSSTGVVNFKFNLRIDFTPREDLLLGVLPMQNNSVNALLQIDCPSLVGTTKASPFSIANIPATLAASISASFVPEYNFFAVPSGIDDIVKYLVSFSYQQISVPANTVSATGGEALQYTLPNNYLLMSMLATIRDGNGALIDAASVIDNPYLNYNNTLQIDRRGMQSRLAIADRYYKAGVPFGPGQVMWDGTDLAIIPNSMLTAGWMNMYMANNPQWRMDVASGTTTPLSYSVLREQIVPAQVTAIS